MKREQGRIDVRSVEPTEVVCEFTFTANGGLVDGEKFKRVQKETVNAFQRSCENEGLDYNAEVSLKTMDPDAFERWATKKFGAAV